MRQEDDIRIGSSENFFKSWGLLAPLIYILKNYIYFFSEVKLILEGDEALGSCMKSMVAPEKRKSTKVEAVAFLVIANFSIFKF